MFIGSGFVSAAVESPFNILVLARRFREIGSVGLLAQFIAEVSAKSKSWSSTACVLSRQPCGRPESMCGTAGEEAQRTAGVADQSN